MKYDLPRPCKNCPFRSDVKGYLTKARVRQIIDGITRQQQTFSCHKTNEFGSDDEGWSETRETPNSQYCAGALIFLERLERPKEIITLTKHVQDMVIVRQGSKDTDSLTIPRSALVQAMESGLADYYFDGCSVTLGRYEIDEIVRHMLLRVLAHASMVKAADIVSDHTKSAQAH